MKTPVHRWHSRTFYSPPRPIHRLRKFNNFHFSASRHKIVYRNHRENSIYCVTRLKSVVWSFRPNRMLPSNWNANCKMYKRRVQYRLPTHHCNRFALASRANHFRVYQHWAGAHRSPANWRCDSWAVKICSKRYRDVRDVTKTTIRVRETCVALWKV